MSRSFLVVDIETVLDPELPIAESSETERLPAPPHHRIVTIGVLWFSEDYRVKKMGVFGDGADEGEMLRNFCKFVDEKRPDLVTYNGRGFDMPVVVARCFKHGVPFPHYYRSRDVRYRFSPDGHLDLMDFVSDFGAAKPSRLDVMAKLCGMPGKLGVDGKHVGPLVHAGRIEEVQHYCLCDVLQTAGIFLRLQLVRGELDEAQYLSAMSALMETARADSRVHAVAAAWNEDRLLLVESPPNGPAR